jgi:hypothetical protein
MFQPLGTKATAAVSRLPHAKAITGQIILYLERISTKLQNVGRNGALVWGAKSRCEITQHKHKHKPTTQLLYYKPYAKRRSTKAKIHPPSRR